MPAKVIQLFHDAMAKLCHEEPLATISEGHVKATLVNALLQKGHSVLEGCNRNKKGRRIWLAGDQLKSEFVPLKSIEMRPDSGRRWSSPDIRILTPKKLTIEIQARCSLGSSSQLQTAAIFDDIERIAASAADLFVMVFDAPIYQRLRETDRPSSRKPNDGYYFAELLPHIDSLGPIPVTFQNSGNGLLVSAQRWRNFGLTRVVAIIYSSELNSTEYLKQLEERRL